VLAGVSPSLQFSYSSLRAGIIRSLEVRNLSRFVLLGLLLGVDAGNVCNRSRASYLDAIADCCNDNGTDSPKLLVNHACPWRCFALQKQFGFAPY
jgi:hypothetical protein